MHPHVHTMLHRLAHPDLLVGIAVRELMARLGPHGGARCIPVAEYLESRLTGRAGIQAAFFRGLMLRNGVYKISYPNRMNDLFPPLIGLAREFTPRPLRVLDVGCSSGISTVEMHHAFSAAGIPCEAWGTDLLISARLVRRVDGCHLLFDANEEVLQVEIGNWASPWRLRPRDLALRPRLRARARRLLRDEANRFRVALHEPLAGYSVMRVSLLSSKAEGVPGVRFHEEDILQPSLAGPFAVIRAANVLNLVYFSPDVIRRMVRALCARLIEGGLLLVSRTEGGKLPNQGTLFRWVGGRLKVEIRANGGSEITDLIT